MQILPGVGQKTASRLAFFLLRGKPSARDQLGNAILNATRNLKTCQQCCHFSDDTLCLICADSTRDEKSICVVEDSLDLLALERTGMHRGTYHVLGGSLAPLDGVGVEDLNIQEFLTRMIVPEDVSDSSEKHDIEVVLATNPTLEGEATAAYLHQKLKNMSHVTVLRLARGIPIGGDVEYTDEGTLARAFLNRGLYTSL